MNIRSKHAIFVTAVENALRPAIYAKGKPIAAMNIRDRMKILQCFGSERGRH
jgi:hypothetical protein